MSKELQGPIGLLSRPSGWRSSTNGRVGVPVLEEIDRSEPNNGVFAIPAPKHIPKYNMAELFYYCQRNNKKPMDLTPEEKKQFILPEK